MRKLISLGLACEVGFQLRQHSGDNTAHFFDWLFTPAEGLIDLIRRDFPVFRPEDLRLLNAGTRLSAVEHAPTGIGFGHQFPRRGKVIPADFLKDYPEFASRIDYLATRFRDTVRADPVQLVRRNMTRAQALSLEEAMCATFPSADMRFLYVNSDAGPFETPLGRSVRLPAPRTPFGESIAWARLLQSEGLIGQPFRLAPTQIVRTSANNQLEEAGGHPLAALLEGRRRNRDNPWFAYELGWKALSRRRYLRAARLAREAHAREPENPAFLELQLRTRLASLRMSRKTALRQALAAIERAPYPGLLQLAVNLTLALGRPSEALDLVARGLESQPYSAALHLSRARALFAAGRLAEAEAAIDEALLLHPHAKACVQLKARILSSLGRTDEAYDLVGDVLRGKRSYRLQILRARLAAITRCRRLGQLAKRRVVPPDAAGEAHRADSAETRL